MTAPLIITTITVATFAGAFSTLGNAGPLHSTRRDREFETARKRRDVRHGIGERLAWEALEIRAAYRASNPRMVPLGKSVVPEWLMDMRRDNAALLRQTRPTLAKGPGVSLDRATPEDVTQDTPEDAVPAGRTIVSTGYETFTGSTYTRIDQHTRYADGSNAITVIYVHRAEYRSWDA